MKSIKATEVEYPEEGHSSDTGDGVHSLRAIVDPFLRNPSRDLNSDYYTIISRPIALDTIDARIAQHQYHCLADLQQDIELLAAIAQTYNAQGSVLYDDSILIEVCAFFRTLHV